MSHHKCCAIVFDTSVSKIQSSIIARRHALTVFGVYDKGSIVISVTGPKHEMHYLHRASHSLIKNQVQLIVPSAYLYASSSSMETYVPRTMQKKLGLGINSVLYGSKHDHHTKKAIDLILHRGILNGTFMDKPSNVSIVNGMMFVAHFVLSEKSQQGVYKVCVYNFLRRKFIGERCKRLMIEKSDFESAIYEYAHEYKVLYSIGTIVFMMFLMYNLRLLLGIGA